MEAVWDFETGIPLAHVHRPYFGHNGVTSAVKSHFDGAYDRRAYPN